MTQLRSNYSFAPTGSYGLRLPDQYSSMGSWGSPDVPDPLNTLKADGYSPYINGGAQLAAFDTNFSDRINAAAEGANSGFFSGMLGPNGWGNLALGAASGLASTFLGMKQYGLAKQTLAENKRQFQLNYDAQKQTTNTRLEDRQRARVASNAGAYQSVGDYMAVNGIK